MVNLYLKLYAKLNKPGDMDINSTYVVKDMIMPGDVTQANFGYHKTKAKWCLFKKNMMPATDDADI